MEFLTDSERRQLNLRLGDENTAILEDALVRVYNHALETMVVSMPRTMMAVLKHSAQFAKVREKFLSEHSGLVRQEAFAKNLAEMEEAHPEWPYEDVLKKAAEITDSSVHIPTGQTTLNQLDQLVGEIDNGTEDI